MQAGSLRSLLTWRQTEIVHERTVRGEKRKGKCRQREFAKKRIEVRLGVWVWRRAGGNHLYPESGSLWA